jgi:alkanesulfonate monooxygenase
MFDRTKNAGFSEQLDLLWFCQLAADGEFIEPRPLGVRHCRISRVSWRLRAEMGFSSLLTATNFHAEHEAWTASIATLARTRGAGLLIAVRPGMFHSGNLRKDGCRLPPTCFRGAFESTS